MDGLRSVAQLYKWQANKQVNNEKIFGFFFFVSFLFPIFILFVRVRSSEMLFAGANRAKFILAQCNISDLDLYVSLFHAAQPFWPLKFS